MRLKHVKTEMILIFLVLTAFILAAAGLPALMWIREAEALACMVYDTEKWEVYPGVPEGGGRTVILTENQLLQGTLLMVDKAHPLPAAYPGPNARNVRGMVGSYLPVAEGVLLHEEAIYALCDLHADHSLHEGITFTRGALSAAQVEEMNREALWRYFAVCSPMEAAAQAESLPQISASEHALGYTLDAVLHPPLAAGEKHWLCQSEAGRWLDEHMWRYGWIDRTEQEGAEACGSIHLRYVGRAHAAAMHALGLGLEAYLGLLRERGGLTLYLNGRIWACIYCIPLPQAAEQIEIALPKEGEISGSADNGGWAIIVCQMPAE